MAAPSMWPPRREKRQAAVSRDVTRVCDRLEKLEGAICALPARLEIMDTRLASMEGNFKLVGLSPPGPGPPPAKFMDEKRIDELDERLDRLSSLIFCIPDRKAFDEKVRHCVQEGMKSYRHQKVDLPLVPAFQQEPPELDRRCPPGVPVKIVLPFVPAFPFRVGENGTSVKVQPKGDEVKNVQLSERGQKNGEDVEQDDKQSEDQVEKPGEAKEQMQEKNENVKMDEKQDESQAEGLNPDEKKDNEQEVDDDMKQDEKQNQDQFEGEKPNEKKINKLVENERVEDEKLQYEAELSPEHRLFLAHFKRWCMEDG